MIVTDDENRENEGDLVMAASKATPETVNMMIRHARGLICVPTVEHQLRRLGISQMVPENRESQRTAFAAGGRAGPDAGTQGCAAGSGPRAGSGAGTGGATANHGAHAEQPGRHPLLISAG